MATLSNTPKYLRGAPIGFDIFTPVPSVILFQYNPATLTRSLKPRAVSEEGATAEAHRLTGAPEETINVEMELDATDRLEKADQTTVDVGLHPQLASLEMLVYPKSGVVIANTVLMATGMIEVMPPESPLTLFIWGARRILPVRLTEFSITEEAFDVNLNPIRAKVSLGMRVLSYNDLTLTHPGYHLFLAHQITKEALAIVGSVNDLTAVAGTNIDIL